MKTCRKCGDELVESNTYNNNSHGNVCKDCHREYVKNYSAKRRKNDPAKCQLAVNESKRKKRIAVISHYSPDMKCISCGFDDMRALSIDHKEGGGTQHRKSIGSSGGVNFYNWLHKNGYPDGYQVLCMNCQFIKLHENKECVF